MYSDSGGGGGGGREERRVTVNSDSGQERRVAYQEHVY